MTLSNDEAREKFSAAYDNELNPADKAAFDAALASDDELRSEYEEFVSLLRSTHALADEADELHVPDLVGSVQARLRARSGGRYFRDKFSEKSGPRGTMPILALGVMLLLVLTAWMMMQYARVLEPSDAHHETHAPSR
ncbi:MAG: hypothetical protein IPK60_14345 [Sandaracinaceae bacterium]|nr:hypothetical protein [Sandaracinaceae bacterium]